MTSEGEAADGEYHLAKAGVRSRIEKRSEKLFNVAGSGRSAFSRVGDSSRSSRFRSSDASIRLVRSSTSCWPAHTAGPALNGMSAERSGAAPPIHCSGANRCANGSRASSRWKKGT
jgi:hypothetical protein